VLKNLGYAPASSARTTSATAPVAATVNGFDEFFGNLYHLTPRKSRAARLPKDPAYLAKFGPRGVLLTKAPTRMTDVDPRFGRIAGQTIQTPAR